MTPEYGAKTIAELTPEEFAHYKAATRHERREQENAERALLQPFSEIEPKPVEWLWPGRIAIGKLAIYAGDPGIGKSQASLDIAARISKGIAFPDHAPCESGDVLILTREDDPDDTIRRRLDALEADVTRIHYLAARLAPDNQREITLLNIETFTDAVDQIRIKGGTCRLLIIDPLEDFFDGSDVNKNTNVRAVMSGIITLAREERFTVIAVQHLNKTSSTAAYRVGGSIAFTALARSVWIFAKDRRNPDRRLFLPLKNNLGNDIDGFEYSIEQTGDSSRLVWGKEITDNLDDVLSFEPQGTPERNRILDLLKDQAPETMSTGDIANALGKSVQNVSNILKKLKKSGQINSPVYGQWTVSSVTPVTSLLPFGDEVMKVTPVHRTDVSSETDAVRTFGLSPSLKDNERTKLPPADQGRIETGSSPSEKLEPEIW
jgi:DNA-binding transcriptional ArsR family regulator